MSLDCDEDIEGGDRGRHWVSKLWWGQDCSMVILKVLSVLGCSWSYLSTHSELFQILTNGTSIPTSKYENPPSWDSNEASLLTYSVTIQSLHQLSSMNTLTHTLWVSLTLWTPLATDGVKQNTTPCCLKRKDLYQAQLFCLLIPCSIWFKYPTFVLTH